MSGSGGSAGQGGGAQQGGGDGSSGLITFMEMGFTSPSLAAGPDDALHLAYHYGASPAQVAYRHCTSSCGSAASWSATALYSTDGLLDDVYLAAGRDGRLHLVFVEQPLDMGDARTFYGTCASGCERSNAWTLADISQVTRTASAYGLYGLLVDASGTVQLLSQWKTSAARATLSSCTGGCDQPSNWTSGAIYTGGTHASLAASATGLHLLISTSGDMMNPQPGRLHYLHCASGCTNGANWQESDTRFAFGAGRGLSVAAAPSGAVWVAYNQGIADSSEPQAVRDQDGRMLVWRCPGNCAAPGATWSGILLGEANDGERGVSLKTIGESLVLSLTRESDQSLLFRSCEADCLTAANWDSSVVDNSEALKAVADPYALVGCSSGSGGAQRPLYAAWYPGPPVSAITSKGLSVVHAPFIERTCSSSSGTYNIAAIGRLIYADF